MDKNTEQTSNNSDKATGESNKQFKGFVYEKGNSKPTILFADTPDDMINKIQSWNQEREGGDQFVTCNIGTLNTKNNQYEDYHKFDVFTGKDVTPIYLKLPHLKKSDFAALASELKEKGAKYNAFNKKWYVTRDIDLNEFANYLDVSIRNPEGKKELENKDADNYKYQDKTFTSDQMAVIHRGMEAKLSAEQMELFANPEFASAQMEEIRFSIMDGLSMDQIRQYATKDTTPLQMDLFRIGLQHGVTYNDICKITSMGEDKTWIEKRNLLNRYIKKNAENEKERKPENYLEAAEMSEEGNYNQIDGIINNVPAKETESKKGMDSIQGKHSIREKLHEAKSITSMQQRMEPEIRESGSITKE